MEGNNESINVNKTLTTVSDHNHPINPHAMAISNEPSQATLAAVQVENPSYNSPAVEAGDSTVLRKIETSQLPQAGPPAMASSNEPSQAAQAAVQVENPSYHSPAVQAGDSTVLRKIETSQLPHAVAQSETPCNTSTAVCGGDPSENSSVVDEDREAFIKYIGAEIRMQLRIDLAIWFRFGDIGPQASAKALKLKLESWKDQKGLMAEAHFGRGNTLSDEQMENICKVYFKVLSNSVGNYVTNSDGDRKLSVTPPWGMLGLGYSQMGMSFNSSNYLIHHALGILAEHLVRKGMLVAANNGGETAGEMEGQTGNTQDPAVDAKSE